MFFSYVAVVSDNDGSAFITKAEFDSLKNNFQAQIDNYNQSIDSKIDGAIASYLAGIKVNTDETPKYKRWGIEKPGTIDSRKVCQLEIGNFPCVSVTTGGGPGAPWGYWAVIDGNAPPTMSDRGYGPGIYLVGAHYTDDTTSNDFVMWKNTTLIVPQYVNWWNSTRGPSQGLNYKTMPITEYGKTEKKWMTQVDSTLFTTRVFIGPLSDTYQQRIGFMEPELKVFQFLDEGTVSLDFMCVHNGYGFEVPGSRTYPEAKDGVESIFENFVDANRGGLWIKKKVPGSSSLVTLADVKGKSNETWFNVSGDVVAGEEWYLTADKDFYGDNRFGFYYGLLFYESQVNGWDIETS